MNKIKTAWEWGYDDRAFIYNIITVAFLVLTVLIQVAVVGWVFAMTVTC